MFNFRHIFFQLIQLSKIFLILRANIFLRWEAGKTLVWWNFFLFLVMCLDSSAFLKPPNAGAIWIPYLESDFHVLPCSLFMSFPQHKMKRWFVINKCFSVVSAQQRNSKVACLHIYRTFTYLFFWMMNLLVCRPQICLNAITECQKQSHWFNAKWIFEVRFCGSHRQRFIFYWDTNFKSKRSRAYSI